jgi:hypothetical protein
LRPAMDKIGPTVFDLQMLVGLRARLIEKH